MWGGTLANAAIFALVLPLYIIMATDARPVPTSPYNPTFTAQNTFAMKNLPTNPTRSVYTRYSAGMDGLGPAGVVGSSEFESLSRQVFIKQEIDMDMEAEGEGEGEIRYPSPFVPIRLPVFTPVLWMMDRVVTVTVGKGRGGGKGAASRYATASSGPRREEKRREGEGEVGLDSLEMEAGQRLRQGGAGVPSVYAPAAGGNVNVVNTARRVRVSVGRRKVD